MRFLPLYASLVFLASSQTALACKGWSTPEKVSPGKPCQIRWDQDQPPSDWSTRTKPVKSDYGPPTKSDHGPPTKSDYGPPTRGTPGSPSSGSSTGKSPPDHSSGGPPTKTDKTATPPDHTSSSETPSSDTPPSTLTSSEGAGDNSTGLITSTSSALSTGLSTPGAETTPHITTSAGSSVGATTSSVQESTGAGSKDYSEWSSTTITLMTGTTTRIVVAEIAINVDMSAVTGGYDIPQAPYLTCYDAVYYYRFVSSKKTVIYSEEFTFESVSKPGKLGSIDLPSNGDNDTMSILPISGSPAAAPSKKKIDLLADDDMPKSLSGKAGKCDTYKVKDSPKGYVWNTINKYTFGYTIIQNVTNIYNNVITTVEKGETITKTIPTTIRETTTMPAVTVTQPGSKETVTQSGQDVTEIETTTMHHTSVITQGGSTVTSVLTSIQISHDSPAPTATSSPGDDAPASGENIPTGSGGDDAPASGEGMPTGTISGSSEAAASGADTPTGSVSPGGAPEGTGSSACTEDDWDETCEDWGDGGLPGASASASATGGIWDGGFGAASGRPKAEWLLSLVITGTAVLGGALFTVF